MNTDEALIKYLRTGETREIRADAAGCYQLPNDWFKSEDIQDEAEGYELYAMPAATSSLLSDQSVDMKEWLIEESKEALAAQRKPGFDKTGPASVLRDPFTAKPYVLFYVTAKAVRSR